MSLIEPGVAIPRDINPSKIYPNGDLLLQASACPPSGLPGCRSAGRTLANVLRLARYSPKRYSSCARVLGEILVSRVFRSPQRRASSCPLPTSIDCPCIFIVVFCGNFQVFRASRMHSRRTQKSNPLSWIGEKACNQWPSLDLPEHVGSVTTMAGAASTQ
jgi:hypothetical protein